MKTFLLLILLLSGVALAADIPFSPELQNRLEGQRTNNPYNLRKYVHYLYDVSVQGGVSGATVSTGFYLPANAVITYGIVYVDTQLVDNGSGTIAILCGSTTLFTAADKTGTAAGAAFLTNSTGTAANIVDCGTSPSELKFTWGPATTSAGKFDLYLEYFLHQ